MLSIIVLSSDGYSDCWDPFFGLLKKNFPEVVNHELILSTNTKDYSYPGLNIVMSKSSLDTSWSKRVKLSLERAKNDKILVIIEDFFLLSKMDGEQFNRFLDLMNKNIEIDHIRLLSTQKKTKVKVSKFEHLDEIEQYTKLRFGYYPGLWKKKILLKYTADYESPYMSERLGNTKSYIYKHGFYAVSKEYVDQHGRFYDCENSGVIFKGRWSEWTKKFFKENNFSTDQSIRGFVTKEYRKNTRMNSKIAELKNPIPNIRSVIAITLLFIKVRIFRIS